MRQLLISILLCIGAITWMSSLIVEEKTFPYEFLCRVEGLTNYNIISNEVRCFVVEDTIGIVYSFFATTFHSVILSSNSIPVKLYNIDWKNGSYSSLVILTNKLKGD